MKNAKEIFEIIQRYCCEKPLAECLERPTEQCCIMDELSGDMVLKGEY